MHLCVKAWSVSGAEWAGKEHNDFRKKRRIGDTLCKRFSMLPKALYYETRIRERQSPMEYIDFLWMPWQITAKLEVKTTKMYFLTVLQAPAYESVLLDSNQGVALSQLLMVLPFLERSKSVGHSVVSDSLPPMLGSLPSFSVHGIFQARILEWLAFPSPEDLPNAGVEPRSPPLQADPLPSETPRKPIPLHVAKSLVFKPRIFKFLMSASSNLFLLCFHMSFSFSMSTASHLSGYLWLCSGPTQIFQDNVPFSSSSS